MEWKRSNSSYSVNVSLLFTMWTSTRKAVTDLKGREAFSEHFQSSRHATSPRGWNTGHFSKMIFHSWFIPGFILHFQMFATLEFNFNKFIFHTFVCLYSWTSIIASTWSLQMWRNFRGWRNFWRLINLSKHFLTKTFLHFSNCDLCGNFFALLKIQTHFDLSESVFCCQNH